MVGKCELPANQPTYAWIHICAHTLLGCSLVRWEFRLHSGDRASHFKPGLNRDRLCGRRSRSSHGVSAESCGGEETRRGRVCMYVDVFGRKRFDPLRWIRSSKRRNCNASTPSCSCSSCVYWCQVRVPFWARCLFYHWLLLSPVENLCKKLTRSVASLRERRLIVDCGLPHLTGSRSTLIVLSVQL